MVTIQVPIYVDRAATIRAGLDPSTESIAVDLDAITQEERDLLADHMGAPIAVTTPTVEDLFETLRATAAAVDALLAELLEAHRDVLRERRVKTWQEPIMSFGEETYEVTEPDWPRIRRTAVPGGPDPLDVMAKHRDKVREITHGAQAAAWRRELDAINQESRDRALREWHEAEEARTRARDEGIARLKEWAMTNGSERVRLLIEENMATWYGVAEDEFFADHTPAGFRPFVDNPYAPPLPAPDAADIHALREARFLAATDDCVGDPALVWLRRPAGPEHDPGGSAVQLTITAPHGSTPVVWRWVSTSHSLTTHQPAPGESEADWLDLAPTVAEAVEEFRRLLDAFDDVRPDEMTTMFYMHAFNELTASGRQLLETLDTDTPPAPDERGTDA